MPTPVQQTFQPRKQRHRRNPPSPPHAAPPAPVLARVVHLGGQNFLWVFDASYADPSGAPWTAADFAGLRVGGGVPVTIDEVIGADGTLGLLYDLPDPDQPGLQYEVLAAPPVLHFDDGRALAVPQNGPAT